MRLMSSRFHTRTVLSLLADASSSRLYDSPHSSLDRYANAATRSLCPVKLASSLRSFAEPAQTFMSPSSATVAMRRSSIQSALGLCARSFTTLLTGCGCRPILLTGSTSFVSLLRFHIHTSPPASCCDVAKVVTMALSVDTELLLLSTPGIRLSLRGWAVIKQLPCRETHEMGGSSGRLTAVASHKLQRLPSSSSHTYSTPPTRCSCIILFIPRACSRLILLLVLPLLLMDAVLTSCFR
mmetsp:Transcript_35749/g.63764  ORF Transcript_35749/g.63764 Transcript_35749/m.63764 type:complete len:239 (+) Transcript_35749:3757-4473(+)